MMTRWKSFLNELNLKKNIACHFFKTYKPQEHFLDLSYFLFMQFFFLKTSKLNVNNKQENSHDGE